MVAPDPESPSNYIGPLFKFEPNADYFHVVNKKNADYFEKH